MTLCGCLRGAAYQIKGRTWWGTLGNLLAFAVAAVAALGYVAYILMIGKCRVITLEEDVPQKGGEQ